LINLGVSLQVGLFFSILLKKQGFSFQSLTQMTIVLLIFIKRIKRFYHRKKTEPDNPALFFKLTY